MTAKKLKRIDMQDLWDLLEFAHPKYKMLDEYDVSTNDHGEVFRHLIFGYQDRFYRIIYCWSGNEGVYFDSLGNTTEVEEVKPIEVKKTKWVPV